MKLLKLTLFLCIFGLYSAQEYLFTYEAKYKADSLAKEHSTTFYTLDIGKKEVKFYPTEALANDSIYRKTGEPTFIYLRGFTYKLKRKVGSNEYLNYYSKSPLYYSINTTDEAPKWTIENDTKTIGNYKTRKAVADFGGRSWVAWFTEEIAIPEGPYKFRGLPGLILEIYDTKANFLFQIKEVKKKTTPIDTQYFLENLFETKAVSISEKQWHKLNIDYYLNPGKDFAGGKIWVQDQNGNMKEVQLDSKKNTETTQRALRKLNNPIELNKAIQYPK